MKSNEPWELLNIYIFICAVCGCPAVCGVGPWPAQARNNDYPQGVSRAHDVALFCKWLGAFMAHNSPRTALAPLLQIYVEECMCTHACISKG